MKKLLVLFVLTVIVAGSALAMVPEVIGGVRDGLAIGIMAENPMAKGVSFRFGAEVNSGKQPVILFAGGKFYMTNFGASPMYLGAGAVAYNGDSKTDFGAAISAVFNRAFGVEPMFAEIGIDVVNTARVQAQLGYKLY
ncbi:MAG: hypothetical protein KKA31_02290 [Candidatus Margulisbacteria bacterium]|nr:hypothetical protein [Candidatus Margulisiibacteriota bacterium]